MDGLQFVKAKADAFRVEAYGILDKLDASRTRVITLHETRKQLLGLSLDQQELFEQALACIERGIYRAAHVMAWAAFMDFLEQKLTCDGLAKIKAARPAWAKYETIEEICESVSEYQLLEVARRTKLLSKAEMKTLHGLLSTRNECAHPTGYRPGLNESLGYVAQLLNRIRPIQLRSF